MTVVRQISGHNLAPHPTVSPARRRNERVRVRRLLMCVNLRSHHVLRRHEVFSLSPTAATIIITITEIAKGMRGGLAHYGLRNVTFSLDVGVPSEVPENVLL